MLARILVRAWTRARREAIRLSVVAATTPLNNGVMCLVAQDRERHDHHSEDERYPG